MKNRIISSVSYIILGALLILTPTVLFPTCSIEKMKMACYYTGRAEIGLGVLIVALGIVVIALAKQTIRVGISIAQIGIGILALLYPIKLIGLCGMSEMDCRIQTFPAIIVISILLMIVSALNVWYIARKERKTIETQK